MKIKPPRQAQEWSYSSHRESIGKAFSSPGIRYNKTAHINCGSSARMAVTCMRTWIKYDAEADGTTQRWRALLTQPSKRNDEINGRLPHQSSVFFYLARAALKPPTSLCKKLFPAIGEWHDRLAAKELSPGNPIPENAFVQVIKMFGKILYKTWCS
ncbi:hypothetical protein [Absidia glauca]|uniref:Ndc10 domain-containing protein n=1 Tax=Absidia glauca TaxID=4829 RepID=A0A168KKS7_ABSGL|nr:hypothetical protein [Absidia glauca]